MGGHSKMKNLGQKRRLGDQSCTRRAVPFFLLSLFAYIIFQTFICASVIAAERGAGGTLRLLYWQAPTIVNPHLSPGTKDWSASRIAYEPLASFDRDGQLIPFLAAEIPSLKNGGVAPDGRSVTWKLKRGVKWADGEPFTGDDDGVREKDGVKLSLLFQTSVNPVRQQTQKIVKAALESVGFEVELKIIDSSIFFGPVGDNTNTRRHFYADLEEYAYGGRSPDPGAYMKTWTCSEIAQQANNWSLGNWGLEGVNITPWDMEVWNIKDWRRKK
jgi:ABC-type transport system substrate-binding protein